MAGERPDLVQPEGDGLDIAHFARTIKQNGSRLLIFALAVALLTLPFDVTRPKLYEAEVTLMVMSPSAESAPVDSFRTFLYNDSVAAQVISAHKLNHAPESLTLREYKDQRLSIDAERGTGQLRLRFAALSPELAATVANTHASSGVALNRRANDADLVRIREQLADQVAETDKKLSEVSDALQTFRQKAQIEVVRADVATQIRQRSEAQQLQVEIAGLRAKAAAAEAALKQRGQTLDLMRSLSGDTLITEVARQGNPGLKVQTQEVNTVYQQIDELAIKTRAELHAAEQRFRHAAGRDGVLSVTNPKLAQLQALEIELARREAEFEIAQAAHRDAQIRYAEVKTAGASRPALQIIDPALPPDEPMPRYPGLLALAAGLSALALASVVLFLREFGRLITRD